MTGKFTNFLTKYNNTTIGDLSLNNTTIRGQTDIYTKLPDVVHDISLLEYNQIPSMFKSTEYKKPAVSISDAIKSDEKEMVLQENMLYTVGSITAATFLIVAIVLARE
jgi:hypothetical protein